jgi:hypothetical protein
MEVPMALKHGEDPWRSVTPNLDAVVDYPASKEEIVRAAEDSGAPVDIINLLMSLPRQQYASAEDAMRDLAEAGRRFGMGNQKAEDGANRDRRNIGRDAVEGAPPGLTRHP